MSLEENLESNRGVIKRRTSIVRRTGRLVKNTYDWSKNHINYRLGTIGAGIGGGIAFFTNYDHGLLQGSLAFGKQAAYVLFVGGYNARTCEKLAKKFKSKSLSLTAASAGSTIQAGVLMYAFHKILGTPDAAQTALTISALNLPAFLGLGYYFRKHHDKGSKGILQ